MSENAYIPGGPESAEFNSRKDREAHYRKCLMEKRTSAKQIDEKQTDKEQTVCSWVTCKKTSTELKREHALTQQIDGA